MTNGSASGRAQETTATPPRERRTAGWLQRLRVAAEQASVSTVEVALYAGLALAMTLLRLYLAGGPFGHVLFNDSYQYLSAAEHVRREGAVATSLVYFDVERAHGIIPAPLTTFPPGLPVLLGLLARTGLAAEWAAVLVSIVATVATVPVLFRTGRALGFSPLAQRVTLLAWASSAHAADYGSKVMAESLFTLMSTMALGLLLEARSRPGRGAREVIAAVLAGAAYWVRYAGLFFVAAFGLYAGAKLLRARRERGRWSLGLFLCSAIVVPELLRNVALTGAWRGGNLRTTPHPLGDMAFVLGLSHLNLFSGWQCRMRPAQLVAAALVLAGAAAVAVAWWRASRLRAVASAIWHAPPPLLLWLATYEAGTTYAALTTDVTYDIRFLVPILPLLLLLAGSAWTAAATPVAPGAGWRTAGAGCLAACMLGLVAANGVATVRVEKASPHVAVARALAAPVSTGEPLAAWLLTNVPRDGVLVSADAQATGYVLKRNVVGLIDWRYSDARWDERATRDLMTRFGATYLVLYRRAAASQSTAAEYVGDDSEFLRLLLDESPPPWLDRAASSRYALVYRLRR